MCAKGVEIMNLESLRYVLVLLLTSSSAFLNLMPELLVLSTMSVPDFSAPGSRNESNTRLAKRCEENTTLGMFRLQDNLFLLVYKGSLGFVFPV